MVELLKKVRNSVNILSSLTPVVKEKVILDMAKFLDSFRAEILLANDNDIKAAKLANLPFAMIERLKLDNKKIDAMISSLEMTAALKDPVGRVIDGWINADGLKIEKIAIPIGVICVIYESRPNVTTEVASLCFKSGNAVILKGGKEAFNSNKAIVKVIKTALKNNGVDENAVTFIESTERSVTEELIKYDNFIDVIIPRGGESLVRFVSENSRIPVIKHDKGLCHIFVDESADFDEALAICKNAKIQNPSACNAVETVLVHKNIAAKFLPALRENLQSVKIYGSKKAQDFIKLDGEADFKREYLDFALNIDVVSDVNEAISHILKFSSHHSEAILSQNERNIEKFLNSLDSACLYVNASTRFSDGFQFGFGAEIGISTNKLHARGPVGLNELTTYKYIVRGNGQVRK